jgi:hypothetical protein
MFVSVALIFRRVRSWAWEKFAIEFNSVDKEDIYGVVLKTRDDTAFANANFDPSSTGYCADANKLKTEFTSIVTSLTEGLAAFRVSGNGDKQSVDDATSLTVFSSYFINYCRGDLVLYYAYCVLLMTGLLESATAFMPIAARASARGGDPSCLQTPTPSSRATSRPNSSASSSSGNVSILAESFGHLTQAMQQPLSVNLAKGNDDENAKLEGQAKRKLAETQAKGAEIELLALTESELFKTEERLQRIKEAGQEPPAFLLLKEERLRYELEKAYAKS